MKTFCKQCQRYRGTKKRIMFTPLNPVKFTDHICGVNNGSVFDFNQYNSCKYFEPKVESDIVKRALSIFKHGKSSKEEKV